MRVAFLTTEYPTERYFAGGLASYVQRVAKALIGAGAETEVFTLSHLQERIWDGPVLVHRTKRGTRSRRILDRLPLFGRRSGYTEVIVPAWNLAAAVYKRHREAPFAVAQASNYRACGFVAALRNTIPVVTRISSYEPLWRTMYKKPLTKQQLDLENAEIQQVKWSAATYAPSFLLAEALKANEGLSVRVIEPPFYLDPPPPGLPETAADLAPESYAMFFGSLGYLKGCDRLVTVLPALLERNPEMRFVFVGPARRTESGLPFDQHIRHMLKGYIDNRVRIISEQKQQDLFQLVQNARLVVLPSRADNLPNACMESMALGRVVIGARGASFEQLIEDGVNGLLVSQEDDPELAACIERVWCMATPHRDAIGSRASETVQRLRPENAIRPLIDLFEEIGCRERMGNRHGLLQRLSELRTQQSSVR